MTFTPQQFEEKPRIILRPRGDGTYEIIEVPPAPLPGEMELSPKGRVIPLAGGSGVLNTTPLSSAQSLPPMDEPYISGRVVIGGPSPQTDMQQPQEGGHGSGILGGILGTLFGTALQFGAQYLANRLAPPKTAVIYNDSSFPAIPRTSRIQTSTPIVEALPIRPINYSYTPAMLKVAERLTASRESEDQRLKNALERNHHATTKRTEWLREMAGNPSIQELPRISPIENNQTYHPPETNAQAQERFRQLLNPTVGPMPFIADGSPAQDYRQFAQKPVSLAEKLFQMQTSALEEQRYQSQVRLAQEQAELALAQKKVAQLQQRALQAQAQESKSAEKPLLRQLLLEHIP